MKGLFISKRQSLRNEDDLTVKFISLRESKKTPKAERNFSQRTESLAFAPLEGEKPCMESWH